MTTYTTATVSRASWLAALDALRVKEKAMTAQLGLMPWPPSAVGCHASVWTATTNLIAQRAAWDRRRSYLPDLFRDLCKKALFAPALLRIGKYSFIIE